MATRKDGCDTCKRLLDVAAQVFAEKGYRATTIAHICRVAKANVAAVNYHFGSKDGLYAEVWRRAFERSLEEYPLDGGLPKDASAEQKLKALIQSHLGRVLDQGRLGEGGQILLMELANPTDAIREVLVEALKPVVKYTHSVIQELLGPRATQVQVHFCAMSVVHQCLAFSHRRDKQGSHAFLKKVYEMDGCVDRLTEHITDFSLAGIAGVRAKIAQIK